MATPSTDTPSTAAPSQPSVAPPSESNSTVRRELSEYIHTYYDDELELVNQDDCVLFEAPGFFPWHMLPLDLKQRVWGCMSLAELFELRMRFKDPHLAQEIRYRIDRLYPLYKKWIDSPLQHRNVVEYRERNNRVNHCKPWDFVRLHRLVLGSTELTELPASIGDMRELVVLYLDENFLSSLPEEIVQLKKLRVLDLMTNDFVEFPKVVLKLTDLGFLSLSFNTQLTSLPEDLGTRLPRLVGFGAFNCSLQELPDSLLRLLHKQEKGFANCQYNRFNHSYIRQITAKYPSLKRKLAMV